MISGRGAARAGRAAGCLSYAVACGAVQRPQRCRCRWDGCSQQGPSVQVGRSECGNLQEEDRNGVGTSRDGQGSDNELGGVAKGAQQNKAGGRTGGVQKAAPHGTKSYRSKESVELTRVESIRRIIKSVFGMLLEKHRSTGRLRRLWWAGQDSKVGGRNRCWCWWREWMERENRVPARGENSNKEQASNNFKKRVK